MPDGQGTYARTAPPTISEIYCNINNITEIHRSRGSSLPKQFTVASGFLATERTAVFLAVEPKISGSDLLRLLHPPCGGRGQHELLPRCILRVGKMDEDNRADADSRANAHGATM